MSDLRTTPAIVKPRKPHLEARKLIVVTREAVWLEKTGEVFPRTELAHLIVSEPAGIVACENAAMMLMELDAFFADFPGWQWRVTPIQRRVYRQHRRDRPTTTLDAVVNYFGFRHERETGKAKTHYHYPIDTLTFLSGSAGKVFEGKSPLRGLIDWGLDVRNFCVENQLKVSPTSGGLAAQLLRDARFFPNARRKIPKATNERARAHLPGNHYELFVEEETAQPDAYYLDMTGAHHYAASQLTFPDPNRLYGRGHFRNPPEDWRGREVWARAGTPKFRSVLDTHGLFLLRLNVPHGLLKTRKTYPPPWLRRPSGQCLAWVYSNELPLVERHGAIIEGVEAAWSSRLTDSGLNRYAEWSIKTTAAMSPERKAWAKPTLLAVYGLLAARPRPREFGYREAKKGEAKVYPTAGGPLAVQSLSTSRLIESPVVNVILRGMIEAEVRMRVLDLATDLRSRGIDVLALYADSVIVRAGVALPLLPEPWRVKTELTALEFFNPVSFVSDQMTRLPGIPRDGIYRLSERRLLLQAGDDPSRRLAARSGIHQPPDDRKFVAFRRRT